MPDSRKIVKAKVDQDNPDAPCILVPGAHDKYEPGEAVIVRYTASNRVDGCVMDYISLLGQWRVQVAPLPEGDEMPCICSVTSEGEPVFNPRCAYHLNAPTCRTCGPGTDVIEFVKSDDTKVYRCSECKSVWDGSELL